METRERGRALIVMVSVVMCIEAKILIAYIFGTCTVHVCMHIAMYYYSPEIRMFDY